MTNKIQEVIQSRLLEVQQSIDENQEYYATICQCTSCKSHRDEIVEVSSLITLLLKYQS